MKTQKNINQKMAVLLLGMIFLSVSFVSAAGVSLPYWDTAGNENPLILAPGESKDIRVALSNTVGDEDLIFEASIVGGTNIASIVDSSNKYFVPAGTNANAVNIKVSAPAENYDSKYKVVLSVKSYPNPKEGQFQIGSGYVNGFDVLVQKPKPQPVSTPSTPVQPPMNVTTQNSSSNSLFMVFLIVLIAIAALVIVVAMKNKKK